MTALNATWAAANDPDLQQRVAACAAQKGEEDPLAFAAVNRWKIAAHGTIADDYAYGVANKTINDNPATGQRTNVIGDSAIEDAVDAVIEARDNPPA